MPQSVTVTQVTPPNERRMVCVTTPHGSAWMSLTDASHLGLTIPKPEEINLAMAFGEADPVDLKLTEAQAVELHSLWAAYPGAGRAYQTEEIVQRAVARAIEPELHARGLI